MNREMLPVYLLRAYAWALIKANTNLKESDYGGLVPIVPLSEIKELSQFSKPHIVYGYAMDATDPLPERKSGSMSFAVYATEFQTIGTIINILSEGFGRLDESAKDVNRFSSRADAFLGIRFGYIGVGFVEGGTPEETEGGRDSGLINIRFEYYSDYTVTTNV